MKTRWMLGIVSAMVMLSVGCRRIDERDVYRIAREHVAQQLGEGVQVSARDEARFAVGKNAARIDLDYTRQGPDPVKGYMTVWCNRIRMRWVFDRAIDHRTTPSPNG